MTFDESLEAEILMLMTGAIARRRVQNRPLHRRPAAEAGAYAVVAIELGLSVELSGHPRETAVFGDPGDFTVPGIVTRLLNHFAASPGPATRFTDWGRRDNPRRRVAVLAVMLAGGGGWQAALAHCRRLRSVAQRIVSQNWDQIVDWGDIARERRFLSHTDFEMVAAERIFSQEAELENASI
jgi:hypothetical protein